MLTAFAAGLRKLLLSPRDEEHDRLERAAGPRVPEVLINDHAIANSSNSGETAAAIHESARGAVREVAAEADDQITASEFSVHADWRSWLRLFNLKDGLLHLVVGS